MGRLHGILSLAFITMAGFIALVWLFRKSTMLGVAYLIVAGLSSLIILYSYCAKCVARDQDCSHVFPGKFTRWLPERKAGPYRLVDQLATGVSLAAIFLFPQYWLWQSKVILVIFWTLAAVALAEILLRVCPNCGNLNCILCRMRG